MRVPLTKVSKGLYRVKTHDITIAHRPWMAGGSQLPWVVTVGGGVLSGGARESRHSSLSSARWYVWYITNVVIGGGVGVLS